MDELWASFESAGHGHVFAAWDEMPERARRRLLRQCGAIDLNLLPEMRQAIRDVQQPPSRVLTPAPAFALSDENFPYLLSDAARAVAPVGERALSRGEVAVLLVAGGQGTRLGFDGPKGCYPLMPLSGMSLFEVFARKLRRTGREYGRTPPLYVMVGAHNHVATRDFFEGNNFFDLVPEDVQFFAQGELPALDDAGRLVMASPDALWTAPDGHGGVIEALRNTGMLADMRARGIRLISYVQVDNMQTPVAEPAFLGLHLSEGAEVSLKVVRKQDPAEKVGIYCLDDGVPRIVEYTEFSDSEAAQRGPDGRLVYWQGSIAVHVFSVEFIQRLADTSRLPLHAARKPAGGTTAWKFERFVFDVIPLANRVVCLEVPREEQFLPLKNPDGPHGPDGVRAALQDYWRRALALARPGLAPPPAIEIDPLLCENARELAAALADRPLETSQPLRLTAD